MICFHPVLLIFLGPGLETTLRGDRVIQFPVPCHCWSRLETAHKAPIRGKQRPKEAGVCYSVACVRLTCSLNFNLACAPPGAFKKKQTSSHYHQIQCWGKWAGRIPNLLRALFCTYKEEGTFFTLRRSAPLLNSLIREAAACSLCGRRDSGRSKSN